MSEPNYIMAIVTCLGVSSIVWAPLLMLIIQGLSERTQQIQIKKHPILSNVAKVVVKRIEVNTSSTKYYVTFELSAGERKEFAVGGTTYGLLVEGDKGTLKSQSIAFRGFVNKQGQEITE